jgi:tyrosine-protein kinase Etk/Wzc
MFNPEVDSTNNQLKNITEKFNTNFDLGLLAFLFFKSRLYIILFFVLSFLAAFLYLRYSEPIYESKAVVQINDANRADDILELENFNEDHNLMAEAMEQIRSKVFLRRVVEKLDIAVTYYNEGTFKNHELYHSSPYLVRLIVKDPTLYGQNIYLDLNSDAAGGRITIGSNKYVFKLNDWIRNDSFEVMVYLNSRVSEGQRNMMLKDQNAFYFIALDVEDVSALLQQKLEVRMLSEMAKTILITVKDVNAYKSTDIVNAITEEYLNYDVERKSESSTNIISFIDAQLGTVYNDLKNTESDLQRFKKEKNYSNTQLVTNSDLERYSEIEDQILKLEMEERIISEIQQNISKSKITDMYQLLSLISGSDYESSIKEITTNIQRLLMEKENLLYAVTPNSENIKQVNFQLENQKKLLLESLDAVRLKYKSKYKSLREKSSDYKSKLDKTPEDEVEFSRLSRLYSISEKYYTMLLEKKTEFSISRAGYVSKNIILEKASGPGGHVSPSRKTALLVALLTSLLLTLGMVFVRYIFHDKIYTLADITRYSAGNVALLGVIPKYESDIPVSQLIVDRNPKALISEAFRTLRTNLGFIDSTPGTKILSITSTISGEGKTFVAINIAGVLAFTGKKVVIIDLDMRKPKIHKGFGVSNNTGMSTILTGTTRVEDCFINSPMDNLKFITAGPAPPNPAELILSSKLDEILDFLKTQFDFIVIDNAPIGLVTDGIATIQRAHYPVYVFRAGYSRKMFTQILDRLKNESHVKNLSVVLNDVDVSRKIYAYNYGYGYGYGYGNGAGYYTEDVKKSKKNFF